MASRRWNKLVVDNEEMIETISKEVLKCFVRIL